MKKLLDIKNLSEIEASFTNAAPGDTSVRDLAGL